MQHKNTCALISFKFRFLFLFPSVFSLSLAAASGLAGWPVPHMWRESTLQAAQQMAVRAYVRPSPLAAWKLLGWESRSFRPADSSADQSHWRRVKATVQGSAASLSTVAPGSRAQVFSLLSHFRDSNCACVDPQADVQDQEGNKWQCTCFRGRRAMEVHSRITIHMSLPVHGELAVKREITERTNQVVKWNVFMWQWKKEQSLCLQEAGHFKSWGEEVERAKA